LLEEIKNLKEKKTSKYLFENAQMNLFNQICDLFDIEKKESILLNNRLFIKYCLNILIDQFNVNFNEILIIRIGSYILSVIAKEFFSYFSIGTLTLNVNKKKIRVFKLLNESIVLVILLHIPV
jgi:hypothetical protein